MWCFTVECRVTYLFAVAVNPASIVAVFVKGTHETRRLEEKD